MAEDTLSAKTAIQPRGGLLPLSGQWQASLHGKISTEAAKVAGTQRMRKLS